MAATAQKIEDFTLTISMETHVKAGLGVTFAALLDQMGSMFTNLEGQSLQLKLEDWPGGRWYRDLGNGNGHYWGTVQAIKKPTLLEICGPLMVSAPVISNVQYRLTEENGGTLIKFRHSAFGFIEEQMRSGMPQGWTFILERVRERAEARKQ